MATIAKIFIILFGAVVVFFSLAVGVTAASIYRSGTIAVDVEPSDGSQISVHVPAALINLAIAVVPHQVQVDALEDAAREVEPFLDAVHALGDELADLPDFVLVEVTGADEHIRIEKLDGRLIVLVESDDERVHVSVPVRTVERLVDKFEDWARAA